MLKVGVPRFTRVPQLLVYNLKNVTSYVDVTFFRVLVVILEIPAVFSMITGVLRFLVSPCSVAYFSVKCA